MDTQIVPGSLSALSKTSGTSLAETFLSCDVIILVDTSGSMGANDSRGGKSRFDVACEELAALQAGMPGKIAVISFSSDVIFCPGGVPFNFCGNTNLAKALTFVQAADIEGMQFILISDGDPDDEEAALRIARTFSSKINVIFVGDEKDPRGREFLERLASATGGQAITADRAKQLKAGVETLLLAGRST